MTLSTFENDIKAKIAVEFNKLTDEGRAIMVKELGWAQTHVWVDIGIAFIVGFVIGYIV